MNVNVTAVYKACGSSQGDVMIFLQRLRSSGTQIHERVDELTRAVATVY